MTKKETIERSLHFLNECKKRIEEPNVKFDAHTISKECRVSNAKFYIAVKLGYFTKRFFPNGIRYFCNVEVFEPKHARKLIETESHHNKKQDSSFEVDFQKVISTSKNTVKEDFIKPTLDDVKQYCATRKNDINPEKWYAHYEAVGWKVGNKQMKDWRAAIHTWEHNNYNTVYVNKKLEDYSDGELITELKKRGYSGLLEIKKEIQF
jgi:hypothetical protein